jgi:hypothetical protein
MLKLKSNTIKDFPFQDYAQLNDSQLEDLAKEHYLTVYNSWMLPQIAAHYGAWEVVWNPLGKVDSMATAKKNMTTPWDIGLWKVCTKLKRGSLVKSQINPEFASYSALVPLVLMGLKKYRGIKYQQWDIDSNTRLVDENLRAAMFWEPGEETQGCYPSLDYCAQYGLGSNDLIALRDQGLMIKSGPKAGQLNKPTSAWCLRGMRGTSIETAPKLVGTMLTQIWVAHPSLRTEYMVLDPIEWDWMPPPLIAENIFKLNDTMLPRSATTLQDTAPALPWDC